jgi:hypothetical protein
MRTNIWTRNLCIAGIAVGLNVHATPLKTTEIPAEPSWLVHLDCDALRPTAIGEYLLAELEKPEAQAKLGAIQTILSFDPRKQLHAITLYSPTDSPDTGVMLINADFDSDRLVTLVKGANDYQATTHGKYTIHNWIDDKKKPKDGVKPRVYGALHGGHLIILAQHEAPVAAALDVLDHTAPNLSSSKTFTPFGATGGSVFLQAAAHNLNFASKDPNAAVLRLSKSLRLQIGELDHQIKGTLSAQANDEEVAKNIAAVAQGLASFVKLQQEKPQAVKLAEALSFKQDGAAVLVTLAIPSDDAVAMLKAGNLKKSQKETEKN